MKPCKGFLWSFLLIDPDISQGSCRRKLVHCKGFCLKSSSSSPIASSERLMNCPELYHQSRLVYSLQKWKQNSRGPFLLWSSCFWVQPPSSDASQVWRPVLCHAPHPGGHCDLLGLAQSGGSGQAICVDVKAHCQINWTARFSLFHYFGSSECKVSWWSFVCCGFRGNCLCFSSAPHLPLVLPAS